ncbi:tRNA(Ile)-lysidine synthase TilS/MesJ [Desulfonispora thiosulfatigenes DSM 11270]|uniref:tRNA(Ile)-lysidine synthase TilS/MesJ n=1 Tax=Desulfonispora thiosulfatigenes DSM 11270 TaxID=656914 RepID=A0A1W1UQ48_DESTI|nr:ATP-binding protein [Desulfonispora thiosulfatigenes]SMB83163.1 tRNA(Ile)-lysidine synthase TilS/MesJ [Desulfonispora thiosulfatigenes DSM 11270]
MWRNYKHPMFTKVKKAMYKYNMIEDNDTIAVGVSGGKDSIFLLNSLAVLKEILPVKFNIIAITLDLGYENDYSTVEKYCKSLNIPYHIKNTDIAKVVFDERKEKSPCSLCAKMRRGALNNFAKELGCNKVALGHHSDDAIETFMLSLHYEGRIHCFAPSTYLSRIDLTVVRPLIFIAEKDIIYLVKKFDLPIVVNNCPANGKTKRQEVKDLLSDMKKNNPLVKDHMLSAIINTIWKGQTNTE